MKVDSKVQIIDHNPTHGLLAGQVGYIVAINDDIVTVKFKNSDITGAAQLVDLNLSLLHAATHGAEDGLDAAKALVYKNELKAEKADAKAKADKHDAKVEAHAAHVAHAAHAHEIKAEVAPVVVPVPVVVEETPFVQAPVVLDETPFVEVTPLEEAPAPTTRSTRK